jgi:hypothetical protein
MANRSVALGQKFLLYTKAYREIAGSVTATILFQRLEYWLDKYPDGIYKFLEPAPNHMRYNHGDSWTEELGFSKDEFRSAFKALGICYSSYGDYKEAQEKFVKTETNKDGKEVKTEMLYCSYYDRVEGLTFYYRNHELVDRKLEE